MDRKTRDQIYHNALCKAYPDGGASLLVSDRAIFREPGWESVLDAKGDRTDSHPRSSGEDLERAQRRARSNVYDYARCNDFSYFVTLTLDAQNVDRYDMSAVLKKLRVYLDNGVRRKGLRYILVPELHGDGAIHFHGLFNDALQMVDSGTIKLDGYKKPRKPRSKKQRSEWLENGGHIVYNIAGYSLGFSTAIPFYGDYLRAVAYVCKYIGKGTQKVGGRWYYSGGDLKRPERKYYNLDYEALRVGEHVFEIPRLSAECVKLEVSQNERRIVGNR